MKSIRCTWSSSTCTPTNITSTLRRYGMSTETQVKKTGSSENVWGSDDFEKLRVGTNTIAAHLFQGPVIHRFHTLHIKSLLLFTPQTTDNHSIEITRPWDNSRGIPGFHIYSGHNLQQTKRLPHRTTYDPPLFLTNK